MLRILSDMNSLRSLYNFGSKLLDIESLESVYQTFVSESAKLVGAQYGSIFLLEGEDLQRVYASSRKLYSIFPRKNGLTAKVLKELVPQVNDANFSQDKIRRMNIKSVIMIPLIYKRKPIGVLTLLSREREQFSEKELRMLQLIGTVASSAIIKARLVEDLQAAVESRDLFIAMASHELKTPLTVITVYSQILKQKVAQGMVPTKLIASLSEEVGKFNTLVSGLLQLNTIQTGKLAYSFSECSLANILRSVANTFITCFPHHQLYIRSRKLDEHMILGDCQKLTQVFTNLLNNAGKFSPKTKPIIVSVYASKKSIKVSIVDKGLGIPKKEIPHVFDKFYKGRSNKPGLGLGLYIVKIIIEAHNGTISVISQRNKGTRFTVCLPRFAYE